MPSPSKSIEGRCVNEFNKRGAARTRLGAGNTFRGLTFEFLFLEWPALLKRDNIGKVRLHNVRCGPVEAQDRICGYGLFHNEVVRE